MASRPYATASTRGMIGALPTGRSVATGRVLRRNPWLDAQTGMRRNTYLGPDMKKPSSSMLILLGVIGISAVIWAGLGLLAFLVF